MEDERAAAYYDELSRKGEGAAKFKRGLGYATNSSDSFTPRPPLSSSVFSSFVRASSPKQESEAQKEEQLKSIKNKLRTRKHALTNKSPDRRNGSSRNGRDEHDSRRRIGSVGSAERYQCESVERTEITRRRTESTRSRSRSLSPLSGRYKKRDRGTSPLSRSRRSLSRERRSFDGSGEKTTSRHNSSSPRRRLRDTISETDYRRRIQGYANMTPAERVKARMKLQLSETAAKDKVHGAGWERFDFNREAPLDDEVLEVAEDDAKIVRDMGLGFRFSAVEAKRGADSEAAHDSAMFGVPVASPVPVEEVASDDHCQKNDLESSSKDGAVLMNEKVLSMQQCSWRDRARKFTPGQC